MRSSRKILNQLIHYTLTVFFITGCVSQVSNEMPVQTAVSTVEPTEEATATPLPTREVYAPGTLVSYTAQDGDTLPAISARFNTTEKEIRDVNPELPALVTTLPAGLPMQIPIYYKALWGTPYQILPNSLFVNGPTQIGFDTRSFVDSQPGWLKGYTAFAGKVNRTGGDLIDYVANEFSISPRLLLAIAEYQAGALSSPILEDAKKDYTLGHEDQFTQGFYLQLVWAADQLNGAYYQWQTGRFTSIFLKDGTIENPDPWQNAATVGIQNYFAQVLSTEDYRKAIYANGLAATYATFFSDPWQDVKANIPGSLTQPDLSLPFEPGKTWAYTGGPHSSWGTMDPLGAIDFAPPSIASKCISSAEGVTAIADGEISRTDVGVAMLDLDEDGDDRTGWVILYLHISSTNKVRPGTIVKQGDVIGYPSCEGGSSTGTHIHIARKFNGEWIPADSAIPFVLDGWTAHNGTAPYLGTLTGNGFTVTANASGSAQSLITARK